MSYWGRLGNSIFNLGASVIGVELHGSQYFYNVWENQNPWTSRLSTDQKIKFILENPAGLYVYTLLADLFSMGRLRLYRNDTELESHPLLDLLDNPNPWQTGSQFLWDYMFHRKLGTANLYIDSRIARPQNRLYFLHGDLITWPDRIVENQRRITLTSAEDESIYQSLLTYDMGSRKLVFPYRNLQQFFDLSNGIDSYFQSPSRVDALYKILANSENLLKAKNINSEFLRKWIVSGKVGERETAKVPMTDDDKTSVEMAMRSGWRTIFPTRTQTAINRFVENVGVFESIDKSWAHDAFVVGKMLNIPKDVMEMLGTGATYENQEKARAMIVSYCLAPDAEDFCGGIIRYFGLKDQGIRMEVSFDHLPFVQALEKDRAEVWDKRASAYQKFVAAGVDQKEVAELMGLEFETFREPTPMTSNQQGNNNGDGQEQN